MTQNPAEFEAQFAALTHGVGLVDFSTRTQIELTGADRAKFLHNLTTNNIRDLPVGSGCEAFLLNVKGHIVGHVFIFACPDSLVIETVPAQTEPLIAHLERYLIRDDVQLHNRSLEWAELLLSGPQAESLLTNQNWPVPQEPLAHLATQIAAFPVWVRRVNLARPIGFVIAYRRDASVDVEASLVAVGAIRCGADAFEAARIEYGMPWFGRDITPENLPQEVDRNPLAISFTKGCYLGQETVARIDALGHVNRLLRGVRFFGSSIPEPGVELRSDGKSVGQVTSACWSPRLAAPLALAYLRRDHQDPGSQLDSTAGTAEVVALPIP